VAALPSRDLAPLLPTLPHLAHNPAVSIGVVNLAFSPSSYTLPIEGFGYLIPRSTPASNNPHHALGVVIDSVAIPEEEAREGEEERLIKLSVLLGGHYWSQGDDDEPPAASVLEQQALETLRLQLGLPQNVEPVAKLVHINCNCVPQYLVGHTGRMRELHETLLERPDFAGRLTVVGSSYLGVGVNTVVKSSWDAAQRIAQGHPTTGLEYYASQ
jgi:oxygen-dependent protoporphyrinogen oxidase